MGNYQSKEKKAIEQQRELEEEMQAKQRRVEEEIRLKEEAEIQRRDQELADKQRLDAKEIELISLQYKFQEETQKLTELERSNQRRDELAVRERELEHERLMHAQTQVFAIAQETFRKAQISNVNEAAYGIYTLQCIPSNPIMDFASLQLTASKLSNASSTNLEQIMDTLRIEKGNCEVKQLEMLE